MQLALPRTNLAVPFVTLLLGAAGGAAVTVAVNDDDVIRLPAGSAPAVQSSSDVSPAIDPAQHPNRLGARSGATNQLSVAPGFKERAGGPATSGVESSSQSSGSNSFGARP